MNSLPSQSTIQLKLSRLATSKSLLKILIAQQGPEQEVHTTDARMVVLNEERNPKGFVNNEIHTAKFGLVNFLPVFLFIMFRRVAYLYFLAQVSDLSQLSFQRNSMWHLVRKGRT